MWPGKTDTEKQKKHKIIKRRKDRRKMSGVNSKIERIQKTSKVVLTVANIMKVFFIAAAVIQGRHMSEVVSGYMLAAMAVMLHFIGRIFRDFRESYSPFQPGLVKELKIFGRYQE